MDEKNTVRAVAIDYKAVLRGPGHAHEGIAELLRWLEERDVAWVLLTNDPMDATSILAAAGLPEPALHLCRDDIPDKAKRGNGAWLEAVADRLSLRTNQLILVGTSQYDWYTGIHAGVVHIHARWASRWASRSHRSSPTSRQASSNSWSTSCCTSPAGRSASTTRTAPSRSARCCPSTRSSPRRRPDLHGQGHLHLRQDRQGR
ncbi:HAD family hydrolase [Streptomyces sp. NPDC054865]